MRSIFSLSPVRARCLSLKRRTERGPHIYPDARFWCPLIAAFTGMRREDLRMRFFTAMKGLSHEMAARPTQIDYARQIALIAQAQDSEELLGVACFAADLDNINAEFAVGVRSDWKGKSVGWALMERLIEVGRQRDIAAISGVVLRENETMLHFSRDLGFGISSDPTDPRALRATLMLRAAG